MVEKQYYSLRMHLRWSREGLERASLVGRGVVGGRGHVGAWRERAIGEVHTLEGGRRGQEGRGYLGEMHLVGVG